MARFRQLLSTVRRFTLNLSGAWLSLARAPGSGPGGRWFESTRPDQSFQSLPLHFWVFVYAAVDNFVDHQIPRIDQAM